MFSRSSPTSEKDLLKTLRSWYETPLGQALLRDEVDLVNRVLRQYHGPNMLQLGLVPQLCGLEAEHFPRRLCLGSLSQQQLGQKIDTICAFHELPIATESQDVVIIHHLLEFSEHPHELLREVERVITPHGKVVIVAFNPFSLLAVRFLLQSLRKGSASPRQLLSTVRLSDWLRLLGFEVNAVDFGFHRIPLNKPAWLLQHKHSVDSWLRHFPLGGTVILSATKYRAPLTPARIRWAPGHVGNVRPLGIARISPINKRDAHEAKRFEGSAFYRRGMSG